MRATLGPVLLLTALGAAACSGGDCQEPGDICLVGGIPGEAKVSAEGLPLRKTNFYLPLDATVGSDGLLYLIDWNNHRVRRTTEDGGVETVFGTSFLGDGPEGSAVDFALNHPTDVAFHPKSPNLMYVAAWHNSRINVVDVETGEGWFECGTGARSYGGDGGPAISAALDLPSGIAFDPAGNLFISDQANQIVRKVDLNDVITRVAGLEPVLDDRTANVGFAGDGGPALEAKFHAAVGQAAAPSSRIAWHDHKLYMVDTDNHVVRVIDLDTGMIDTIAGIGEQPGYAGDGGPATSAKLASPRDVEVASDGTVYVADTFNHCVRRIGTDGIISTVAGTCGLSGYAGDGGAATEALLFRPYGIELDGDVLYIADTHNHVFRKVLLP